MRAIGILGLCAGLLGVLAAGESRATTFKVLFVERNSIAITPTNAVAAAVGDTLLAELSIIVDADGVQAYAVSVQFDPKPVNELDLLLATLIVPPGFTSPIALSVPIESTAFVTGFITSFGATFSPPPGPTGTTLLIGEMLFKVTPNVVNDGVDILPGFFAAEDSCLDNAGNPCSEFEGASVNLIPEPATALLVAMGCAALALWRGGRGARARG